MNRLAALVPNVLGFSPGQRARCETWAKFLPQHGWEVDFYPFEDDALHEVLYAPGNMPSKAARMLRCYGRSLRRAMALPPCNAVLIYREAALIGPAVIERIARRIGVPLLYDIDDPVFLPHTSEVNGWFSLLKFASKSHALMRFSDEVISINRLLGDYARRYNPNVTVIPNFVDTEHFRPGPGDDPRPRLVWTGSLSTIGNLATIREPLVRAQSVHKVPFRVIGVNPPDLAGVEVDFKKWSAATEVAHLQGDGIGLVPLPDGPVNEWKFFLKVVQYLSVGLPVIARRMGSNPEVIEDGVNGFLVDGPDDWFDRIGQLLRDGGLRRRMGEAARRTAVERYSVKACMPAVAALLDRAVQRTRERDSSAAVA